MPPTAAPGFGGIRRRPQRERRGTLGEAGTLALQFRIVAARSEWNGTVVGT
jgi:hypothetical protein